ncbi:MAG: hypothetical protein ACI9D8_000961, partial [Reinekea sp.]
RLGTPCCHARSRETVLAIKAWRAGARHRPTLFNRNLVAVDFFWVN